MPKFVPLSSMTATERREWQEDIEDLIVRAQKLGLRAHQNLDGHITIETQLMNRESGKGFRFRRQQDVWPGSVMIGKNPEY